jgi:nitrogen fixation protein NifU and related proteins
MPGLEDLYREIILDHYRSPRNRGELVVPPAVVAEGVNPLCGDEIKVFVLLSNDVVEDVRISGQGCSISQSSASMMSQAVKGKSLQEAQAIIRTFKSLFQTHDTADDDHDDQAADEPPVKLGDLEALQGVVKFPARIKCATLAWNTLVAALEQEAPA